MRFRIVGADKHTGEPINTVIEASDQFHAMRQARDGGVDVREVTEVQDAPIQRVVPQVIQPTVQPDVFHPPANSPERQVVYVIERQVQVPARAPAQSPMPVTPQHLILQPQVMTPPPTPPTPPTQVVTHVHVSNNSSSTSSSYSRAQSHPGSGCLAAIAKSIVVVIAIAALAWWVNQSLNKKQPPAPRPTSPTPAKSRASVAAPPTTSVPHATGVDSRALADAERQCLEKLRQTPEYTSVKNAVDEYEAKVKASRADPRHPLLESLSQQWMDAKNRLSKLESDALASDPAVQAAKQQQK
jgi:hypothetical protein